MVRSSVISESLTPTQPIGTCDVVNHDHEQVSKCIGNSWSSYVVSHLDHLVSDVNKCKTLNSSDDQETSNNWISYYIVSQRERHCYQTY